MSAGSAAGARVAKHHDAARRCVANNVSNQEHDPGEIVRDTDLINSIWLIPVS